MCAACSCDSSVLTCDAHLFWRKGTLRCHWRPRPRAGHPLTTRAKDVQGGWSGRWWKGLSRLCDSLFTLVCTRCESASCDSSVLTCDAHLFWRTCHCTASTRGPPPPLRESALRPLQPL